MYTELKKGPITLKELSEWFGLKPETISRSTKKAREKKFEKLKGFCKYHFDGKKIIIDEVITPKYSKALELIEKEYYGIWGEGINPYHKKNKVDTSTRIGRELWYRFPELQSQITEQTSVNYANKAKIKDFGSLYRHTRGKLGSCEFVWFNPQTNNPLTEEELKIMDECIKEAYESLNRILVAFEQDARNGFFTIEEYDEIKAKIDSKFYYDKYIDLVFGALNFIPIKKTKLIKDGKGAWE